MADNTKNKKTVEQTELEYPKKNFLQHRIVKVEPIPQPNEWRNLVGEALPQSFMLEGTTRTFDLPRDIRTGQFKKILDDKTKVITPQFPDEPMTELEFFSRMIGYDLSFTKREYNYWTGYVDPKDPIGNIKPYRVKVEKEGMSLDLSSPEDHLKYKVLLANSHAWIAPSWAEKFTIPTYMFALVDEKVNTDSKKEMIQLKRKANAEFDKIADSDELLREFLIVKDPNNIISKTASKDFVFNQVYEVLEKDPKYFLTIVEDPYRIEKILVYKAVRAGALIKSAKDRYETPGGETLGSMGDLIHLLNEPEKLEFRKRLEYQIETNS